MSGLFAVHSYLFASVCIFKSYQIGNNGQEVESDLRSQRQLQATAYDKTREKKQLPAEIEMTALERTGQRQKA